MTVRGNDIYGQPLHESQTVNILPDGWISSWLVIGPFEQRLEGFGNVVDEDPIDIYSLEPVPGKVERSTLVEGGKVSWMPQSVDEKGYLDFNQNIGWAKPGRITEKIWYAKAAYACVYIDSKVQQEAILLMGSNAHLKVYLNGQEVHTAHRSRNAQPDEDKISLKLKKGRNLLLVRVSNTHHNITIRFFAGTDWGWGFYARLRNKNGGRLEQVQVNIPRNETGITMEMISTFFFKDSGDGLNQRFDLIINSSLSQVVEGNFEIVSAGQKHLFPLGKIPYGVSRHQIYLPEVKQEVKATGTLHYSDEIFSQEFILLPQKHYEFHLMLLTHTDIGYTSPQPLVKEIHINVLDDVLAMCEAHPDFQWTVETLWQLEQFEQARPPEQFEKLMKYVKEGRIALSPLYSNPFTGWISEEEMIRSFWKAREYSQRYQIDFTAAIYNDVPGFAWRLPGALSNSGVNFLVAGINEVYNNYAFQQNLPKAFYWEGSDGQKIITYRTEAYNEGMSYGMERGTEAMEYRIWERLNILESWGYPYDMVLINSVFIDNGPIPESQFFTTTRWNEKFAFPKIQVSNLNAFAGEFTRRFGEDIPTIKGDWTSAWDILYQGELSRMKRHRWVQHQLLSAEKMATIAHLMDEKQNPMQAEILQAYRQILHFSGHGSGLEFGYGSPEENDITSKYRETYVQEPYMAVQEQLQRTVQRFAKPEESFEGEAILVFNTLSWERDAVVEFQFPEVALQRYQVVDLTTNDIIPAYRSGYRQYFVARNLPSLGYKKFRLKPIDSAGREGESDLVLQIRHIENAFYRIQFDPETGKVSGIWDKKLNKELLAKSAAFPFNLLMIERALINEPYSSYPTAEAVQVRVIDERPVCLRLELHRPAYLLSKTEYILWENLDRVDVVHTLNLDMLTPPETAEEYGVAFPFDIQDANFRLEVLGGFLNPRTDRFPGISHDAYSIRRSAAIYNEKQCLSWAAVDNRVIRLRRPDSLAREILLVNLVNNFPQSWNRNETNEGFIELRFSFTSQKGGFKPGFTSRFGWEASTPPVIRKSWLRSNPPSRSFFTVSDENVMMLTLQAVANGKGFLAQLINVDSEKKAEAAMMSKFIEGKRAYIVNNLGKKLGPLLIENDKARVELKPNEIKTILFETIPPANKEVNE